MSIDRFLPRASSPSHPVPVLRPVPILRLSSSLSPSHPLVGPFASLSRPFSTSLPSSSRASLLQLRTLHPAGFLVLSLFTARSSFSCFSVPSRSLLIFSCLSLSLFRCELGLGTTQPNSRHRRLKPENSGSFVPSRRPLTVPACSHRAPRGQPIVLLSPRYRPY